MQGNPCSLKFSSVIRPGYIYLFGENKEWNSSDNLKIFGKVWKFRAAQSCPKLPQNLQKCVFEINM